jgi:micrococcal nuclease
VLYALGRLWWIGQSPRPLDNAEAVLVHVARAVDGDTLLLADGRRVRLIGVDTPETKKENTPVQPWGTEAHAFTSGRVDGRRVRLEFDRERQDHYGRLLAYVYVDDLLLNEELLRAGLARLLTRYPYRAEMKERFYKAQEEAHRARRGLWSKPAGSKARGAAPESNAAAARRSA